MPFESLSHRYTFSIPEVPSRWIPLIHLYDPDLPLFPIYYFHVLPDGIGAKHRPLDHERAFGYVETIALCAQGGLTVTLVLNKDLAIDANAPLQRAVVREVRERFGINNPVTETDVRQVFAKPLDYANAVLPEMWHRVVANAYGNVLPFGRLWDEVLGLVRFVASWNSQSGRKGELIQTHYFASRFGVRVQSAADIPQVDFFLLPTIKELLDHENPLNHFPAIVHLLQVADAIVANYCEQVELGDITLSRFVNPKKGRFDTAGLIGIIQGAHIPHNLRPAAFECFNAFGKGPPRAILFLLMLHDLRHGLLQPSTLTSEQCGSIYDGLGRTYQSPKAIQIYAQQCFGNPSAMPVDTWIETFFKWPLRVHPMPGEPQLLSPIFARSNNLGKVERLLWVTSQARKVHSSACNDAIWCVKYGSNGKPRGTNPLACNICLDAIRECCPAYSAIKKDLVCFNGNDSTARFQIVTSAGNNKSPNQAFVSCEGDSIYVNTLDDFSPADNPQGFAPFPAPGHKGKAITVEEFVRIY